MLELVKIMAYTVFSLQMLKVSHTFSGFDNHWVDLLFIFHLIFLLAA